MSAVVEFPDRGKSLRELIGKRVNIRFNRSQRTHPAFYFHAIHNNPVCGKVEGVALQTFCRRTLAFVPFDDSLLDEVSPYVESVEFKEVERRDDEMCGRCLSSIRAAMMRGEDGLSYSPILNPLCVVEMPKQKQRDDIQVAQMRKVKEMFEAAVAKSLGVTVAEMKSRGLIRYKKDGELRFALGS